MSKIPKLRFKEFSGEWESIRLGELGEFKKTYSFSRSVEGKGDYKHIHYGDIHMNYNGIISKDKLIPSIDIPSDDNYELIKEKDIIFADASEDRKYLGKVAVVRSIEGNVLSGLHTMCFRPNETLSSEFFLNHSLNKEYLKFMYTRGNGAKVLGISKANLSEYKFLAPSKEEQEKIASFFSLIDDKISLQGEKVEALKDHKKGMMQKIFSRELRFKDDEGRDYPEWEEKSFREILTSRIEKQIPSQEAPLMAFTSTGGIEPKGEKYDRSFLVKSDEKLYKRTELNDFIYSSNNLDVGSIGLNKYGTAVISDVYEIFIISKEVSCNFISELIQTPRVLNKVISYRQGVMYGQYRIHADEFLKIRELIPCLEEQNKIANFLFDIDEKINKEQEKLDFLNEYKKGLLQQMFV
ncbi:restriction endonuclease subunit S [Terrisporobacter sp.]|uniref:restriction endonuclease subunit S n=1 Tax=Terrisporobacter sp. TaxID=1965305 RepID=UPI002612C34C|nr:restriction endonuclease subunit S [Terrisporobacter sp.]